MTISDDKEQQLKAQIGEFVSTALKIPDSSTEIAEWLKPIRQDESSGIFSVEFESPQIGDAAFLIYHYDLSNPDDQSGKEQFEDDLQTLHNTVNLDLPGPRPLAHATTDLHAFILATSPHTYRALTGDESAPLPESDEELEALRRDTAIALLMGLRDINQQASRWLDAVNETANRRGDEDSQGVSMMPEETALAMHIADGANVQDLLHALNFFVEHTKRLESDLDNA